MLYFRSINVGVRGDRRSINYVLGHMSLMSLSSSSRVFNVENRECMLPYTPRFRSTYYINIIINRKQHSAQENYVFRRSINVFRIFMQVWSNFSSIKMVPDRSNVFRILNRILEQSFQNTQFPLSHEISPKLVFLDFPVGVCVEDLAAVVSCAGQFFRCQWIWSVCRISRRVLSRSHGFRTWQCRGNRRRGESRLWKFWMWPRLTFHHFSLHIRVQFSCILRCPNESQFPTDWFRKSDQGCWQCSEAFNAGEKHYKSWRRWFVVE